MQYLVCKNILFHNFYPPVFFSLLVTFNLFHSGDAWQHACSSHLFLNQLLSQFSCLFRAVYLECLTRQC